MLTAPALLSLQDLHFRWPGSTSFGLAVNGLQMKAAEKLLLLGASGSGKSTLLSLICGTIVGQAGQVVVDGTSPQTLPASARDRFRAENIGIIFQQFNLLPFASVLDNILLPLQFAPKRRTRVASPRDEARRLCSALGLDEAATGAARAGQLSVGQQQRVAAARALIGQPKLIVADEPTSALDARTQATFLDLLFTQCDEHGSGLLMVSHDQRLAGRFDRVIDMTEIAGQVAN